MNACEYLLDKWPPGEEVYAKMIQNFGLVYAKMKVHSANIAALKYENQKFANHINLQITNKWKLETRITIFWYFFLSFFLSVDKAEQY